MSSLFEQLGGEASAEACPTRCGRDANKPVAEKDPIAELRGLFCERMVPLVLEIAERHRPKGVTVSMDASGRVAQVLCRNAHEGSCCFFSEDQSCMVENELCGHPTVYTFPSSHPRR